MNEIPCNIIDVAGREVDLAEIDENLIRLELTALERAEQLQRRKWIFGQKGGTKCPTPGGEQEVGFAKDTADKVGLTKRHINRDIAIADGIPDQLRNELRDTDQADSREDLAVLARAKKDPAAQRKAVAAVKSGVSVSVWAFRPIISRV